MTKTRTALTGVFGALAGRKIDEDALQPLSFAASSRCWPDIEHQFGRIPAAAGVRDGRPEEARDRGPRPANRDHRGNITPRTGPHRSLGGRRQWCRKNHQYRQAAKRFSAEGKVLAAADTFRAGAVQLEVWAERLGVDIIKGKEGADPAAVAWDGGEAAVARNADFLIVDTAGRLHVQEELMRQLSKIKDVLGRVIPNAPHESLQSA